MNNFNSSRPNIFNGTDFLDSAGKIINSTRTNQSGFQNLFGSHGEFLGTLVKTFNGGFKLMK